MDSGHESEPVPLKPEAVYGNLAFDQFIIANWDISQPKEEDQSQWNDLASRWLSMSHVDRSPFWNRCNPYDCPSPNSPYLPTETQIQCTLAPHQTTSERNASQLFLSRVQYPVWIRTCYTAEFSPVYREMFEAGQTDFGPEIVLDNKILYAHPDADWTKVFLRIPALVDTIVYHDPDRPENDDTSYLHSPPSDEDMIPLYDAVAKSKSVHYLIDEEALRERMVKLQFLDIHGISVWWNWLRPEHIWIWEAHAGGPSLSRHLETCVDDRELLRPGTVIDLEE